MVPCFPAGKTRLSKWNGSDPHKPHPPQPGCKELDAAHCKCPFGAAGKEVGYDCPGTSGFVEEFSTEISDPPYTALGRRGGWHPVERRHMGVYVCVCVSLIGFLGGALKSWFRFPFKGTRKGYTQKQTQPHPASSLWPGADEMGTRTPCDLLSISGIVSAALALSDNAINRMAHAGPKFNLKLDSLTQSGWANRGDLRQDLGLRVRNMMTLPFVYIYILLCIYIYMPPPPQGPTFSLPLQCMICPSRTGRNDLSTRTRTK